MIRIGILGDISSGKSFIARKFGYPVFNADNEVSKLYKNNKKIFTKLKRKLPKYISSYPINKKEITNAILGNKNNLKKIIDIVHNEVQKKLKSFIKKNRYKKIVILDIPLLLENKINKKKDILVFVDSKKKDIKKQLLKRKNYDPKLFKIFKKIQLHPEYKKRKSNFIIKNNFTRKNVNESIKKILNEI